MVREFLLSFATRALAVISILLVMCAHTTTHAKSETINSFLAAIDSANGQSRLDLNKGFYRATSGSSAIVFEVPSEMGSTLKFQYKFRSMVSASWEFENFIYVNLTVGGKCVRIKVKKFAYSEGGFLTGSSDQEIVPNGPCQESEPLTRMNDFLRLSPDAADFFRGAAFVSLEKMRKCTNSACTQFTNGLPVRVATFYGSSANGQPLPALRVGMKEGERLILPKDGYLVLAANSEAVFNDLVYDLDNGTGKALVNNITVTLRDGLISGGQTTLRLKQASKFSAEQIAIEKDDLAVRITRGSIVGELGDGTSLLLTNDQTKSTILNISTAKIDLIGMNYVGGPTGTSLSFLRGVLATQVKDATIWFTDRNSVQMGYTNIDLILGCDPGTSLPDCKPVSWTPSGIDVQGSIKGFSTTVTGGEFNVTNYGLVRIKGGSMQANALRLDSRDKISPITGVLNKFELGVEGQEIQFDGSTRAKAAHVDVKAYDILFKTGQSLPIGKVAMMGTIVELQGGQVGKAQFQSGARLELSVERRDGDEPEITDGNVLGDVKVRMDGGNFVDTTVSLQKIRYYRGHGDAVLTVTANSGAYSFSTPAAHDSAEKLGFRAEVDVKSITLTPRLSSPLVLGPTSLKASQSFWKVDPLVAVPFKFDIPITGQELVYAPIKTPVGGTLCAPKVELVNQQPSITGKLDVFAASNSGKVKIYDNALSSGIVANVNDRGCDKVADLVCFMVGTAVAGPIGGVGLALLCDQNLEAAKTRFSDTIRDESMRKVADSRFEFSY